MKTNLDQRIGQHLAGSFRHESRRSFLSRLTRGLFALAGVSLPAALAPYAAPAAQGPGGGAAPNPWEWCGLHGYVCQGNCAPNANGNVGRLGNPQSRTYMWVMCCRNPQTQRWRCVRYADYCGQRGPTWGQNCRGTNPAGAAWCGGAPGYYICTDVQVVAQDHNDAATCARGCYPDRPQCAEE